MDLDPAPLDVSTSAFPLGTVIGAVALFALLLLVLWWYANRMKRRR